MNGDNYFEALAKLQGQLGRFSVVAATYRRSVQVNVAEACYGWLAINYGNGRASVENVLLLPRVSVGLAGGAFGFMDNNRMYDKKQINLNILDGVSDPLVQIIQICLI